MADPEVLDVPPVEAVETFRGKGYHVGFDWRDTLAGEHARSFTVAKAMRLDVLQAVRADVDRALAEGTTLADFRKRLEPRLKELGWWGRQEMVDPATGEVRMVQLGSPRRLKIIFDTNLRTSYARGRWQRIERLAEARPWLRYVATLDERTRPDHMAWHGTVLPVDHPFWRSHYPPNGWLCRCSVVQLSDDDLQEFGYAETPPPGDWRDARDWRDSRSGRVWQVPRGIDPGFQFNSGLADRVPGVADQLISKMEAAPPDIRRAAIGSPWGTRAFRSHLTGTDAGDWPVAVAGPSAVRLSPAVAARQAARYPDVEPGDYARVQRIVDDGAVVTRGDHSVAELEIDGQLWRATWKGRAGKVWLTSLRRTRRR